MTNEQIKEMEDKLLKMRVLVMEFTKQVKGLPVSTAQILMEPRCKDFDAVTHKHVMVFFEILDAVKKANSDSNTAKAAA